MIYVFATSLTTSTGHPQNAAGRLTAIPKKSSTSTGPRSTITRRTTINEPPREITRGTSLDRSNRPSHHHNRSIASPSPEMKRLVAGCSGGQVIDMMRRSEVTFYVTTPSFYLIVQYITCTTPQQADSSFVACSTLTSASKSLNCSAKQGRFIQQHIHQHIQPHSHRHNRHNHHNNHRNFNQETPVFSVVL